MPAYILSRSTRLYPRQTSGDSYRWHPPDVLIYPRDPDRMVQLLVEPFAEYAEATMRFLLLPGFPVGNGFY